MIIKIQHGFDINNVEKVSVALTCVNQDHLCFSFEY